MVLLNGFTLYNNDMIIIDYYSVYPQAILLETTNSLVTSIFCMSVVCI